MLEHGGRDVEVGDHAVLERTDRHDRSGRAADHFLGRRADGEHRVAAHVDRHNGRLTHHNALAFHENQGVRGAEINADILGKHLMYPLSCLPREAP